MDFYAMSDKAILTELGSRIKALRLRRNKSQEDLSKATLLSLNSIKSLEAGKAKLSTCIAVLRELRALEELDNFIPAITISPIELAKRRGKKRLRAHSTRSNSNPTKGK